jgi:hypothetical protein
MKTVQNRDAEVERAVLGYVAAWNEDSPDTLAEILEECWAEHGMVISNYETVSGRRALYDRILTFRRDHPGTRGFLTSSIEHHHDIFRFTVIAVKPDGRCFSPALDVGELDASGRIERIVTFFHELQSPPQHWPAALVRREPIIL